MSGLNQCINFALFMVIITALIGGTQDLGPEILNSRSFGDLGRGIVVGLCVAAIGITVDQIITRWAHRHKEILGIAQCTLLTRHRCRAASVDRS